mgnify:CR=1 FL=1
MPSNIKTSKDSVLRGMWRNASKKWRFVFGLLAIVMLFNASILSLSTWYGWKHRDQPVVFGGTFIANYARYYNLDPNETLTAMINDLGIKHLRLVSYWSEHEKSQGVYDFTELDQQFAIANQYGAKVSLAIGLRQPRWPECHLPTWAANQPASYWEPPLMKYIAAVVERYRGNPALESYQLENEFFLKAFGECPDHNRDRLVAEFDLVKRIDSDHPLIVSRSNNALGWPIGAPTPDIYGVSVYKRVWDKNFTKRYFEYPFPPQFYGSLAGISQITQGRDLMIHELQAEAWGPTDIIYLSLEEQDKTMDATKLSERIDYGKASGMKRIDLWGAEYWYWRMVDHKDPSLWNAARAKISQYNTSSATIPQTCGVQTDIMTLDCN